MTPPTPEYSTSPSLRTWFDAALQQPAPERTRWLAANCPDATLREAVGELLNAHGSDDRGLPPAAPDRQRRHGDGVPGRTPARRFRAACRDQDPASQRALGIGTAHVPARAPIAGGARSPQHCPPHRRWRDRAGTTLPRTRICRRRADHPVLPGPAHVPAGTGATGRRRLSRGRACPPRHDRAPRHQAGKRPGHRRGRGQAARFRRRQAAPGRQLPDPDRRCVHDAGIRRTRAGASRRRFASAGRVCPGRGVARTDPRGAAGTPFADAAVPADHAIDRDGGRSVDAATVSRWRSRQHPRTRAAARSAAAVSQRRRTRR